MRLEDFDFELPPELIAKYPLKERHMARLMVLNRKERSIKHDIFWNLPLYLEEGDLLVFNDTKVIPARLYGEKPTGGKVEVLLTDHVKDNLWYALVGGKNIKEGLSVQIAQDFRVKLLKHISEGKFLVELLSQDPIKALYTYGHIPIPPYLEREEEHIDRVYYQTVFAQKEGSVAAPTASLHFSEELLNRLDEYGIRKAFITLHVSYGTFKPIKVSDIRAHKVDEEYMEVPEETVELIKKVKQEGKKVVAVGTTVVRALETKPFSPFSGKTDLYIYPGYTFKVVDAMITNFHLPRSSLLLLVSAFAGREFILSAYQIAIKERYRFYSYGDGMLIL
ncbi:MAG: tRNA preQ1(34) S-adenosylmethionine ribosyltransferase-isomerase QueA [Hydrogenobacter thermophilus]|uniref:tRNA preQ1(34) S-adenosylmethionine ribosyltransferase-isomerase QueA n=1 Tax=Hydrogenobacter thermophilus TaxID=940 RepID=UPI001C790540|nr:tRNA preQ1(34) S-adenosylmethionine ribosyltransferase-isomerase QueA [Hydrogenobacter thermophilus]QWK20531.1 MAG: tRNA preQ1(34) S-adenosylmethionine ribosyltransferase-isomerase QueA [Hydrogenobacter thermophilus]